MSAPEAWPERLARRLRGRARGALLLLLGFAIGAATVALRSCAGGSEPAPADHADHAAPAGQGTLWTCSMHPQIRASEPGTCPICGMDLIVASSSDEAGGSSHADRIVLSERARALAKLRTSPVRRRVGATAKLRLLGRFEPNETTRKTVTAWTGGRIDRLHVNVTGQRVEAGQVIATLYSPEVFVAHQDLLVGKRQMARMKDSPETTRQAAGAALEAARERLRLLGVPDGEIARMETRDRPTRAVDIRTPYSGTVIERLATEGAYVSTGTPLYRVAKLGTLWLQLDAYERDLSQLSVGQNVRVLVEAFPGEEFDGKVTFIDPTLDARRRTAQIRVQVVNQKGRLRPGMFAEATVDARDPAAEASPLVIPATAPLFTGRRALVYVELAADDRVAYEPRTVRLGPRLGDVYPVVAGLSEGDRVVTRGAFALDADLQIRGGPSMMTRGDDRSRGAPEEGIPLSAEQRSALSPVVTAYLAVQVALADDDLPRTKRAAADLARATEHVQLERPEAAHAAWSELSKALGGHAQHLAAATDLPGARQGFEPLSEALIELLARFGNPLDEQLRLAFCPMASGSQGALWIQRSADIDNSYFGASMLTCGEVRAQVAPGAFLRPSAASERGGPTERGR